jgi:transcriptional regulator with XRE-family HTH domain
MTSGRINFREYLHELRATNGYSLKKVAVKLGIDIRLLIKIEQGEGQFQGHMLK